MVYFVHSFRSVERKYVDSDEQYLEVTILSVWIFVITTQCGYRDGRVRPKVAILAQNWTNQGLLQIGLEYMLLWLARPKWDKSGTFSDQISVRLAHRSEKVPDLSHLGPIWPTLKPNLASLVELLVLTCVSVTSLQIMGGKGGPEIGRIGPKCDISKTF